MRAKIFHLVCVILLAANLWKLHVWTDSLKGQTREDSGNMMAKNCIAFRFSKFIYSLTSIQSPQFLQAKW